VKAELPDRFLVLLERIAGLLQTAEGSEIELTKAQRRVLFHLGGEPRRMGELAALLGTSLSAATSMVDRLVDKGLVERVGDPADRRVVLCRLTALGREEAGRQVRLFREVAGRLSEEELERVVQALELLAGVMERGEGARSRRSTARRRIAGQSR
jgi:DNA-binding MarR family transcriptional regulator